MKKKTYDNYDYEEAYQKQIDTLEEWELERLLKEKKVNSLYRTTTTKAGNQVEIDIYPSFGKKADVPRTKRKRESKPSQKNLNDRRARRYLNQLTAANFGSGDLWGTFGYDDEHLPADIEDAQRIFTNFIRRINRKRKKEGKENLKYIYVTEYSDDPKRKIRCHHHIIFSGFGSEVKVETFDGMEKLDIPAGTQAGSKLRIRGRGMPRLKGKGSGDMNILVKVKVPKSLTAKERELLKELAKESGQQVNA